MRAQNVGLSHVSGILAALSKEPPYQKEINCKKVSDKAAEEQVLGDGWLRWDAAGSWAAAAVETGGFSTFLWNACVLGEGTLFKPLLLKY